MILLAMQLNRKQNELSRDKRVRWARNRDGMEQDLIGFDYTGGGGGVAERDGTGWDVIELGRGQGQDSTGWDGMITFKSSILVVPSLTPQSYSSQQPTGQSLQPEQLLKLHSSYRYRVLYCK